MSDRLPEEFRSALRSFAFYLAKGTLIIEEGESEEDGRVLKEEWARHRAVQGILQYVATWTYQIVPPCQPSEVELG
jgi:hypothetical protein